MKNAKQKLMDMNINGTVVSMIIEREHDGDVEVLLQTRWKPDRDPVYSGTLEIPAGGIESYENVYTAAKREVWEETGLRVTSFYPDIRTPTYAPRDDDCFAFVPFCCQQQLKGGIPRIGIVFICRVADAPPRPGPREVRDIVWAKIAALREIVEKQPERVFTLQLPVLDYYLRYRSDPKPANYILKQVPEKGYGVFATRDIKQGEHIFHVDLNEFQKYTLPDLERAVEANPALDGDHANYVGHGKYVIEKTPAAYMNHACDPNCYFKMQAITVYNVYAFRDIAAGEELTHDYTACSVDQFDRQGFWVLECHCGSENCRGEVTGDFFAMPAAWQAKYYPHLPPSIKRKYRDKFQHLKQRAD